MMGKKINVLMVTAMPLDDPADGATVMVHTLADFLAQNCGVVLLESRWEVTRLTRLPTTGIYGYEMQLRAPCLPRRALHGAVAWLALSRHRRSTFSVRRMAKDISTWIAGCSSRHRRIGHGPKKGRHQPEMSWG